MNRNFPHIYSKGFPSSTDFWSLLGFIWFLIFGFFSGAGVVLSYFQGKSKDIELGDKWNEMENISELSVFILFFKE